MNLSAIDHGVTLPYRQPLARNQIHFRILTARDDCAAVTLRYWKRDQPSARRSASLAVRCRDGLRDEWTCDVLFPEEAHYIRYYFILEGLDGETVCCCEQGFSADAPERGFFEVLQANETDVLAPPAWSSGIVYYQIFPERFAVGDAKKALHAYVPWDSEPTRENFFGGDLAGVREKLPYLQSLGAECLYLTPVFAGDFNHKYATADYFHVDPDFGTDEELTALVRAAHAIGIRVILDGVFNHAGVRFAPFADVLANGEASRYKDWFYIKRFPVAVDASCYECVGDYPNMPRLRTANPDVREYILRVMLHWMEAAGIDGWRLDVADELDARTLRCLREGVKARYPEALLLGETWGDASRLVCEGDQLDCAMNYLFRDAMIDFFAVGRIDTPELANRLGHMLMKYPDAVNLCMYNCLDSHDTARFLTEAHGERWRLKLAIAFQMLFPGSPALFYGDELGMTGENDPGCRAGMAWDRPDAELLDWTREMIALRKSSAAVRRGSYRPLSCGDGDVFALERRGPGERLTAVFNRGDAPKTLDFTDGVGTITVPPRSVKIIH
jgi:cyclomaltodextrinase